MAKHVVESFAKIVRCGDCQFAGEPCMANLKYAKNKLNVAKCKNTNAPCNNRLVYKTDFCSYGKAKEG